MKELRILTDQELSKVNGGKIKFIKELTTCVEVGHIVGDAIVTGAICCRVCMRFARKKSGNSGQLLKN